MSWKTLVSKLQEISAILSISANALLIFLVVLKSPKQIGSYKYLMIYISIFEICYSIIDVLIEPIIFSHGSIFLVLVDIEKSLVSRDIAFYLISFWGQFFGSFMGLFVLQFIYRYFVAAQSIALKSFNDWRIIVWMCCAPITGVIWGALIFFCMHPDAQIDKAIRNTLLIEFDWRVEQVSYNGPYLYRYHEECDCKKPDVLNIIGLVIMWIILITSIILIIFSAIKCYKNILIYNVTTKKISRKNRQLQYQLFYALVTQTLIPVILMHLPVAILYLFTMLDVDLGHASAIVTITIALFPALDPFPVMLIIKSYRNAITSVITTPVLVASASFKSTTK